MSRHRQYEEVRLEQFQNESMCRNHESLCVQVVERAKHRPEVMNSFFVDSICQHVNGDMNLSKSS